jgi:cold shock CspA family protein
MLCSKTPPITNGPFLLMRTEGTLAKWNDDRGFGFIAPTQSTPEVFVHISAFPRSGRRPTIGERLTFEIEIDSTGKKRAKNLLFPNRPATRSPTPSARHQRREKPGFFGRVILLFVVVALAFYGYSKYSRHVTPPTSLTEELGNQAVSSGFRCDGRTHCSQMTSCAEATFFLQNCPNVEMDGNHDGVPCEQQWCTSPFSK